VDVAEYRAWDTPAPMTGRPGTKRIAGSLGPISRQIPLGEEEFLRLRQLETQNDDPIIDAIFADAERMTRSVSARIELARGDIVNDGAVVIAENGLSITADYGRDVGMSVTAPILWTTHATAKPLTDLLGYQEDYVEENGVDPGVLLMPRSRVSDFALNQEMLNYAASGGTTPTRINRAMIDDILSTEALPPIYLYDTHVRVNGVRTRVLPASSGRSLR
jgi:hypothetical protein